MKIDERTSQMLTLLVQANTPMTGNELADKLAISRRSIQTHIKDLRELLAQYGVKLISKKGTGFMLDLSTDEKKTVLARMDVEIDYTFSQDYRIRIILERLFNSEAPRTIASFADELFISKSLVSKDLSKLNERLATYDAEAVCRRNMGILLQGNEFGIRQAYKASRYEQVAEDYTYTEEEEKNRGLLDMRTSEEFYRCYVQAFPGFSLIRIQGALHMAERRLNTMFTTSSWLNLLEYVTLMLLRQQHTHSTSEQPQQVIDMLRASLEYKAASELVMQLSSLTAYQRQAEIDYLAVMLLASVRQNTIEDYEAAFTQIDPTITEKTQNVLAYLGEVVGFPLDKSRELLVCTSYYIDKAAIVAHYGIGFFINQGSNVQAGYRSDDIFIACISSHCTICEILGFDITNESLAYIAMLICNVIYCRDSFVRGAYVSHDEYYMSRQQANKIESMIPEVRIEHIIRRRELSTAMDILRDDNIIFFSPCAFLTTTFPVHQVVVSKDFCTEDANNARRELFAMRFGSVDGIIVAGKESGTPLTSAPLVAMDKVLADKFEVIQYAAALLQNAGYVTQDYWKDVVHRENASPTALQYGVAIPHGAQKHILRSGIAVIRLKQPVLWSGQWVDLVFLLALTPRGGENIGLYTRRLYGLLCDPDARDRMRVAQTKEELIDFINEH